MDRLRKLTAAFLGLLCLGSHVAHAIGPTYASDRDLAKYPIIVVAKWEKSAFKAHNEYDKEKILVNEELYTRLNVLAVVKGKVQPGQHDLLVNWGIAWKKDGTELGSGTSTWMRGDVDDITKPCLWFLERTRSWDKERQEEYLTVGNFREVQALELKAFFAALADPNAKTLVPRLLDPEKPNVARRVLRFISDGAWTYNADRWPFDDPDSPAKVLHAEAGRVWEYLQASGAEERRLAARVFAELAGRACIAKMRTLLNDDDPGVRGVAVSALAHHQDEASLDRLANAASGLVNGPVACRAIKELAAWRESRTVPALIVFLQNDQFAYQIDDDIGIPALKAREALLDITGHVFPFDVELSQRAWREARTVKDSGDRKRLLQKIAPGSQTPLVAEATGRPGREMPENLKTRHGELSLDDFVVTIRLRNTSSRSVTVLKYPSGVDMHWPAGASSWGSVFRDPNEKVAFTTIPPSESIPVEVIVHKDVLIADPTKRAVKLSFWNNGNHQGVKAWIGTIKVGFGPDWEYERKEKLIVRKWKNGNLKATGKTVNGVKLGEWNYFNEQGDRIRIEYPGTGRGTSICNSDHPTNKGTGKRPK